MVKKTSLTESDLQNFVQRQFPPLQCLPAGLPAESWQHRQFSEDDLRRIIREEIEAAFAKYSRIPSNP